MERCISSRIRKEPYWLYYRINIRGIHMSGISRNVRSSLLISALLVSVLLIGGCASGFTTIAPQPPAQYEKLGPATGKATGSIGILSPVINFIPMGLNSRVDRAYEDAITSVPGATGLIDVTLDESWFWWLIGTGRTVTISGEAIREIK